MDAGCRGERRRRGFDNRNTDPGLTLPYLFCDSSAGSLRIVSNGVAGAEHVTLRGPLTDVPITGGAHATNTGLMANGRQDESRLYGRALTASGIAATWNLGLGAVPVSFTSVSAE